MKKQWEVKRLGEVCEIVGGGTPSKSNAGFYNGDIRWATVRDIKNDVITDTEFKITKEAVKNSSTNIIPKNNVVIATRVGLGKVCLLHSDTAINQDLKGIIPKNSDRLSVAYLFHWLKSVADVIEKNGTGATVQGVKITFIEKLQIPIPPLSEQQRIVAILDESSASIAKAMENAEKNLRNARELFESYLQKASANPRDTWVMKPLGTLASFRNGINYTKDSQGEKIRVVGVKDFKNDFWVPLENLDTVTIDGDLSELDALQQGDVLVVRSNGNIELIGRCILAGEIHEKIAHSGFTIRIRLSCNELDPQFLCHFMKCASSRKCLTEGGTGTNIKSLNQATLSALAVPVPSLSKQKTIVAQLDALSIEAKRLETVYQRKLASLEELKQSMLRKAFAGGF